MSPEEFDALQARYDNDPGLRDRLAAAPTTGDALAVLRDEGYEAQASDVAQLLGAAVELDLDQIDDVAGGRQEIVNITLT